MTREERAQQLWSILVLAARNRQVLIYDMVGKACGVPAAALGDFLRPVQQYCTKNDLPPLTSIIVSQETGLPGGGCLVAPQDLPRAHINVFAKEWLAVTAPTAQQFAAAYARAPQG
jgi:putative restriction endonuclease